MRKAIHFTGAIIIVWMLSGCTEATTAPAVPPTQTIPPSLIPTTPPTAIPTSTLTATAPPPLIVFESADFPRLSVSIPTSIASGAESQVVPLGREDTPTRQDIPRHALIDLKGYPGPTIKYQGPAIRVFTVMGLELGYGNHVENARKVIAGSEPDSGIYPALPIVSGATQIQIRMQPLTFQNGRGFRYLEYENTPSLDALNDQYMNYIYQGISADGKHYISVIMPVTMPFLNDTISIIATQAASMTTPVPEQLLLLPVLQKLQSADDSEFSPSLAVLDEIVTSLNLSQP